MSQSRRDDFGRLWLQPGATTRTTGTAKCWRVKSMQQVSIPGSFKRPAINSNMTLASVAPMAKCDGAGDLLQQRASIGIHHRAAQMGTVLRRGRSISALAAFGCDDGLGKLARAHLERGAAGRRLTLRPAPTPETSTIGLSGMQGTGENRIKWRAKADQVGRPQLEQAQTARQPSTAATSVGIVIAGRVRWLAQRQISCGQQQICRRIFSAAHGDLTPDPQTSDVRSVITPSPWRNLCSRKP
ncbi:hypothetical protein FFI89_028845 [Bradyrhizobium sp. KBS0727]|uniref:hypothetical protein n=1 Tax=unclassified Bradyrhizobium TaxID=2631580 RepID=UPI00110EDD1B|nr:MULTISPECIES: hypothetical protein [unclassified Bradyrhizobium]QDW40782.1 hypothetical protein FFI71_028850 [Bradyrhizobium sp. KBS0725]QDW47388.1 hypothetical protein FFI89_028845 [Bradyrhizobium sp. KBS0727]